MLRFAFVFPFLLLLFRGGGGAQDGMGDVGTRPWEQPPPPPPPQPQIGAQGMGGPTSLSVPPPPGPQHDVPPHNARVGGGGGPLGEKWTERQKGEGGGVNKNTGTQSWVLGGE